MKRAMCLKTAIDGDETSVFGGVEAIRLRVFRALSQPLDSESEQCSAVHT